MSSTKRCTSWRGTYRPRYARDARYGIIASLGLLHHALLGSFQCRSGMMKGLRTVAVLTSRALPLLIIGCSWYSHVINALLPQGEEHVVLSALVGATGLTFAFLIVMRLARVRNRHRDLSGRSVGVLAANGE